MTGVQTCALPIFVGLLLRISWVPDGFIEFIAFGAIYFIFGMIFYVLVDSDLRRFAAKITARFAKSKHFPFLQRP